MRWILWTRSQVSYQSNLKFLDHKGQVSKALEQYIRKCRTNSLRLEIGTNTTFHSDGDQVYRSNTIPVAAVCSSERMFQSFSPPYHANLNGAAERTWRTLGNDGRAMMSSAKQIRDTILDDSYWPLAMLHASFLRNLTPRGNRQISAYEKLSFRTRCRTSFSDHFNIFCGGNTLFLGTFYGRRRRAFSFGVAW